MICVSPIKLSNGKEVPCAQCMACRINKKRFWTGRILLETLYNTNQSTFLTLTYNQENHPEDGSLRPEDLGKFLNRLRKQNSGIGRIRYFAVGEYGDKSKRPHYHAILFGQPPSEWLESKVEKAWSNDGQPLGFISIGDVSPGAANYVAGYTTKKMTSKEDYRLDGRYPEFVRMSRRPPLGNLGMIKIRDNLYTYSGSKALAEMGDVPDSFEIYGKEYPIGRYWKTWLRNEIGIDTTDKQWQDSLPDTWTMKIEKAEKIKKTRRLIRRYERSDHKNRTL